MSSSTSSSGSPRTNEWRKSLVCFYTDEDEDVAEEAAGAGTNVIDLTETTTMLPLATASSCDAVPTPPTPPTHGDAGADVWVAEWDGVQYSSSSSAAGEEAQPQQRRKKKRKRLKRVGLKKFLRQFPSGRFIAEGGMKPVFDVVNCADDDLRKEALALIPRACAGDEIVVSQLVSELGCPNFVRMYVLVRSMRIIEFDCVCLLLLYYNMFMIEYSVIIGVHSVTFYLLET